jgi:hypothetical protein
VTPDVTDHLVRRAPDAVCLEPGAHVAAVDLRGALERLSRAVLRLGDHDEALLRDVERVEVAADLGAARAQRFDLSSELALKTARVVPDVGVPGRERRSTRARAAADQDGRPATGFGCLASRTVTQRPSNVTRSSVHATEDLGGLLERDEPVAQRREGRRTPELGGEPAAAETDDRPAVRHVVDRRDLLREHGGVPEERRRDGRAELDAS